MLGGYVGQFLPLAGGTLTGSLSLGGKLISNVATIQDNQSSPKVRLSVGAAAGTGDTKINDVNGATQIDVSAGLVTIENSLAVTGSASFSGTVSIPNLALTARVYATPHALGTLYVDPINGNDTWTGTALSPFATVNHATSVAVSGDVILVAAGLDQNESQIVLPAGVHLKGMGMDVTILQGFSFPSGSSPFIVFGTGSVVSDLTIDLTQAGSPYPGCIGCLDTATAGSTQFGLNPSMYRVKCMNVGFGLNYQANNATTATSYLYMEDCVFISNTRSAAWLMTSDANFTVDAFRCRFLWTYSSTNPNLTGECVFAEANGGSRFFNCVFSMTDTIHTSWSTLGYQMIDSDHPMEVYGCHFLTNFPSLPALPATTVSGTANGFFLFSNTLVTKIGAGCTVSPDISDIGASLYQTLPSPSPHLGLRSITVSSSTATPWGESGNAQFEIAVDAATLSSDTLTLANVNVSANTGGTAVPLVDGQVMRLRIKNTNAGSAAMTLAFGSTYNNGSTSVSTIAAGKRAYLTYTYDADNSKWDLTAYTTGL